MDDPDDDVKARKRRRRSIRNLRRQSGIVPFSLGEEASTEEQNETTSKYHMSCDAIKPVEGVSDQI